VLNVRRKIKLTPSKYNCS